MYYWNLNHRTEFFTEYNKMFNKEQKGKKIKPETFELSHLKLIRTFGLL